MSGYENVIGGLLKLKGKALDVKAGGIKKKKKHKKHSHQSSAITENDISADMVKSGKNSTDPTWEHCTKLSDDRKGRLQVKCKYCGKTNWGGVYRMKHHLAGTSKDTEPCVECPEDVRNFFINYLHEAQKKKKKKVDSCFGDDENVDVEIDEISPLSIKEKEIDETSQKRQRTMLDFVKRDTVLPKNTFNTVWKAKEREDVCQDICRCFYANSLPFNLVKDPFFITMLNSVAEYGKGFIPPSYHEVRVTFFKKEVESISKLVEKYKDEWKKTGCTLILDGWTDNKDRSMTNFLVNSPRGTVFLKSVDTSDIFKNVDNLFELIDSMVEEIGEENVVQVVTDSAPTYVKAGEMLMMKRKKLFWNPCAAHCLDLILSDIGDMPIHKDTMSKARKIAVFIYRHSWVINLMRKYTKDRELTRAAITRFATSYLTLRRLNETKIALTAMFTSEKWQRSQYSKEAEGKTVCDIILADKDFWSAIQYCLKCTLPLVKVLRLVDGDAKPAMGYIYEAMDKAKEQIAKNFNNVERRYKPIWDIIDKRWNMQLHRPLHAAAYYLNPRFHYAPEFNADYEIKKGLYETIEKMCSTSDLRAKVDKQLDSFHNAKSLFGIDMAKQMRDKKQPALWWDSYGDSCKELQSLAIRILSLTCSATGCERNWSTFDQVHTKRRNRLEQQRLNELVFIKYNLRLQARHQKRVQEGDAYDPISLSDMESDDEWITEKEGPSLPEDTTWMNVNECFEVEEGEYSKKRKKGPRDLNKKGQGKQVVEVDDEEEEIQVIDNEENGSEELFDLNDDSDSYGC